MKTITHITASTYITKRPITIGISILVGILTVVILMGSFSPLTEAQTPEPQASPTPEPQKQNAVKLIVYYFHGTFRCASCSKIEELTNEVLLETFGADLKNGVVEWKPTNVETPANQHFVQDYKLYTKSVIVSEVAQGKEQRWKNLARVWELVHNEKAFKEYIRKEIAAYLEGQRS
jgi:hypothetical protein